MPLTLREKTLLTELKRRSSWDAFIRLGGRAATVETTEGRVLLRALRFLHRNGSPEILDPETLRRAVLGFGRNGGESVADLGEPLSSEHSAELVWHLIAQGKLAGHHQRLQEEALEGRFSPDTIRRVVGDWKNLSESSAGFQGPLQLEKVKLKIDSPEFRLPVSLHKCLDLAIGGGLRRKEVGIIVGPTDHGKTANLLRVACGLVKRGLKVFFMSFEVPIETLKERAQTILHRKRLPPTFYANEYPSDELAVEDVVSLAKGLKGLDCLIVDHLNLLRFEAMDLVNAQGSALRKLRNYAIGNEAIVWTAAQADDPDPTQLYLERYQLYGSRQIMHAAALAIGILYSPTKHLQTYALWKTKHARNGLRFMGEVDFVKGKFRDL